MDDGSLLDHLRSERAPLAALAGADLTAPVEACPGWTVHDLLGHLGMVHRMAMRSMATPPGRPRPPATERPPAGEAVVAWLLEGLDRLVATFETSDLDQPCATWAEPADVRWWLRRQVHETVVHRWDAQHAATEPAPLDGDLAADGLAEWLELQHRRGYQPPADLSGTLHLHATDGEAEWLVQLDGAYSFEPGHHKGDVAVRGTREALFLGAWGRLPADRLERLGDAALWDRFLESLRF